MGHIESIVNKTVDGVVLKMRSPPHIVGVQLFI
jgi:hypothetical protein